MVNIVLFKQKSKNTNFFLVLKIWTKLKISSEIWPHLTILLIWRVEPSDFSCYYNDWPLFNRYNVFGLFKSFVWFFWIHRKKVFLIKLFLAKKFSTFTQNLEKINECLFRPVQCAISNIISLCVRLEFKRLIFCLSFF